MAKKDIKGKIIDISLDLAQQRGWDSVSLRDIADAAEISLADLFEHFEDKTDILVGLGRRIDHAVLEGLGKTDENASPRERLFDVLMDRYEILNQYRSGIIPILESFRYDPKQAVISLPHLCRSMTWMLEAAGIETQGIKGAVRVAGLTGVYLKVLKTWKEDDSADIPKTMAALDKALASVERAANTFGF